MLPIFNDMYSDAMMAEELKFIVELISTMNVGRAISNWEKTSSKIEMLIPRLASVNIEAGKKLFEKWKYTREEISDPRELSYRICTHLLPYLIHSMSILYGPLDIQNEKLKFEKTESGFLTVKDLESGKYLHSPYDPFFEAYILAKRIYKPDMSEFHIWGCGLGYLAYQIWELSNHSTHIFIYEDDCQIIEYAQNIGILSWIDESYLTIENTSEALSMFRKFVGNNLNNSENRYISDWKIGTYKRTELGNNLDIYDDDIRMRIAQGDFWAINIRKNRELSTKEIENLPVDYNYEKRDFAIVSAGPSLNDNIEFLRKNNGKMIIVAINTVLRRLAEEGIKPDLVTMLDPTPLIRMHIDGIEDFTENIPLIFTENSCWSFSEAYKGPKYVIKNYDNTKDGFLWNFGGTVTSLALDLAYYFRASKIYLIGSDLAFSDNRNYADGTTHGISDGVNNNLYIESTDGGMVATNQQYNRYREIIENQINKHDEVVVVNMANKGAKIRGAQKYDK